MHVQKHGYNLEWRTCLQCDTIKLYNQNSIASFTDLGSKSSREFSWQRSEVKGPAIENFSADDPYDFDSFDGPSNYSERRALTPNDAISVFKENYQSPIRYAIVCTKTQRLSLELRKGMLRMVYSAFHYLTKCLGSLEMDHSEIEARAKSVEPVIDMSVSQNRLDQGVLT
ncbi:hypothetical protein EAE96_008153 [Botrytis aclada]|nr:hypothetical protein EAE96_008153 [Botrytis aclada]